MEETKTCPHCYTRKPLSEYHVDRSRKDGRQSRCKECHRATAKDWWKANGKESYAKHKGYQAQWRKENPERYAARQRRYHLKRKYEMTVVEFQQRLVAQEGKCACCGESKTLVIDHDHASGSVRSLLCQPCNKGLGCFFDDPAKLRLAAEYLEKHNAQD